RDREGNHKAPPQRPRDSRDDRRMTDIGLALVLILAWAYLIGSTVAALRFARRRIAPGAEQPAVSVLKPLHGAEPGLYENLRSFVDQDYPDMQIVLGVRRSADAALPIARALMRNRPGAEIELVINPRATGSNLKVANLENMLPAARHDIIVLADSDMRVDPQYLAAIAGTLRDPRTGLVTCLYKGMPLGGTSCGGRARCGQWPRSALPARS